MQLFYSKLYFISGIRELSAKDENLEIQSLIYCLYAGIVMYFLISFSSSSDIGFFDIISLLESRYEITLEIRGTYVFTFLREK